MCGSHTVLLAFSVPHRQGRTSLSFCYILPLMSLRVRLCDCLRASPLTWSSIIFSPLSCSDFLSALTTGVVFKVFSLLFRRVSNSLLPPFLQVRKGLDLLALKGIGMFATSSLKYDVNR